MKKPFVFTGLIFLILIVSCNKETRTTRITKPITAGEVSKTSFVYKEFDPPVQIKVGKDTGMLPVIYIDSNLPDTHLPNFLIIKYEPDFDNLVTFRAYHTPKWGSKYFSYSEFSAVTVSGSSNVQLCPKPLQKGDSISNSLEWLPSFTITTNDTTFKNITVSDTTNIYPGVPYVRYLWTSKSYMATRVINSSDTTFGWFQMQSHEDSATVSIFKYGYQE
ncbi:MAG TPA: hypothetical protein VFT78_15305 [Hanamia sp.]|nr:hypothetical protein [Hanamia sp.]